MTGIIITAYRLAGEPERKVDWKIWFKHPPRQCQYEQHIINYFRHRFINQAAHFSARPAYSPFYLAGLLE